MHDSGLQKLLLILYVATARAMRRSGSRVNYEGYF